MNTADAKTNDSEVPTGTTTPPSLLPIALNCPAHVTARSCFPDSALAVIACARMYLKGRGGQHLHKNNASQAT